VELNPPRRGMRHNQHMPSVNPPVDASQAGAEPDLELADGPTLIQVGGRRQCDTLPAPCAFRFAILRDPDGRTFTGYLWEQ
jgi:hypothetical protein